MSQSVQPCSELVGACSAYTLACRSALQLSSFELTNAWTKVSVELSSRYFLIRATFLRWYWEVLQIAFIWWSNLKHWPISTPRFHTTGLGSMFSLPTWREFKTGLGRSLELMIRSSVLSWFSFPLGKTSQPYKILFICLHMSPVPCNYQGKRIKMLH